MYPQLAQFGIGWRPCPRYFPRFLWLRLLDLTTRPDYKIMKGKPMFTEHIILDNDILKKGPEIWEGTQRLCVDKMSYRLGCRLVNHLVGMEPKTISVTLERTERVEVGGDDFHMTVWEFGEEWPR